MLISLTQEDIKEFNKKYKRDLNRLRIDIENLSAHRRTKEDNELLYKLTVYRYNYTTYGGLAYNSPEQLKLLKQIHK